MHPCLLSAVATKNPASVMDALPHLAGMVMVMASLTILWWICVLTARIISAFTPVAAEVKPEQRKTQPQPAGPEKLHPEIVAVIAAAVATTLGGKCRIISIKPQSPSWERAGRHAVLTSHRIR